MKKTWMTCDRSWLSFPQIIIAQPISSPLQDRFRLRIKAEKHWTQPCAGEHLLGESAKHVHSAMLSPQLGVRQAITNLPQIGPGVKKVTGPSKRPPNVLKTAKIKLSDRACMVLMCDSYPAAEFEVAVEHDESLQTVFVHYRSHTLDSGC